MNEVIKKEAILLDYEADTWEEAVLQSGMLLCKSGLAVWKNMQKKWLKP